MSYSNRMLRYHPEHHLLAPVNISLACLSPSAGLLALARDLRVSLHPIPQSPAGISRTDLNEEVLSVYTQDGPCEVSALGWLAETIFVTGFIDGSVVFTSIAVGQESDISQPGRLITKLRWFRLAFKAAPGHKARTLAVLTESDVQLWDVSSTLLPTCKGRTSCSPGSGYLSWSSRAHKSVYVVSVRDLVEWDTSRSSLTSVARMEPDHQLKRVSRDGRYRLDGIQRSNNCRLTYTDTFTGKQTCFKFPTPNLQDRSFLTSFVHDDKLVLIASSHKIVLWDPAKDQLALQEFYHPTRDTGTNASRLTAISAASRSQFSGVVHTVVSVRGAEVIVWQASSSRPVAVYASIALCALMALLFASFIVQRHCEEEESAVLTSTGCSLDFKVNRKRSHFDEESAVLDSTSCSLDFNVNPPCKRSHFDEESVVLNSTGCSLDLKVNPRHLFADGHTLGRRARYSIVRAASSPAARRKPDLYDVIDAILLILSLNSLCSFELDIDCAVQRFTPETLVDHVFCVEFRKVKTPTEQHLATANVQQSNRRHTGNARVDVSRLPLTDRPHSAVCYRP
ncbi:hypothetical protein DFH06DRAFT_1328429 [Mycena polygramma]|nr:hypothetical protein DFH06DRAFT_1328429 [Mycena polygramma]